MTQVRYFGFVKAEEPWTGNQFKMYAGKNGSTFGSKVPAGSVVECGYKSISSADSAARELKSRCEKMGRRVFCWGYESVAEVQDENRIHGNAEVFELRPSPDGAVHLGVSWPSIGTVPPEEAKKFAEEVTRAAAAAAAFPYNGYVYTFE